MTPMHQGALLIAGEDQLPRRGAWFERCELATGAVAAPAVAWHHQRNRTQSRLNRE